jgi:RNA polymerase sigma factor (sigma-70 family)
MTGVSALAVGRVRTGDGMRLEVRRTDVVEHQGRPGGEPALDPVVPELAADVHEQDAGLDGEFFGDLFERHFDQIHRYLARRAGADVADDLAAETFVQAIASRGRFDPAAGSPVGWLFGIAANLLRRHWRNASREQVAHARIASLEPSEQSSDVVVTSLVERLAAQQVCDGLIHVLRSMPPGELEALLLLAWEDLTYAEMASALDVPIGTVRSRLHRARGRLRDHLDQIDQLNDGDRPPATSDTERAS